MSEIEALEREIAEKKAELRALKASRTLCYEPYKKFKSEIYGSFSLARTDIINHLRGLAICLVTLKEHYRELDGSVYLATANMKPKVCELTKEQTDFCNNFINDIYPIIEKYANIILTKEIK